MACGAASDELIACVSEVRKEAVAFMMASFSGFWKMLKLVDKQFDELWKFSAAFLVRGCMLAE